MVIVCVCVIACDGVCEGEMVRVCVCVMVCVCVGVCVCVCEGECVCVGVTWHLSSFFSSLFPPTVTPTAEN